MERTFRWRGYATLLPPKTSKQEVSSIVDEIVYVEARNLDGELLYTLTRIEENLND